MAKYILLRGIARNFAHSYTSLMHHMSEIEEYFMNYVFRLFKQRRIAGYRLNVINGEMNIELPKEGIWSKYDLIWIRENIEKIGIDFNEISSIILELRMDPAKIYKDKGYDGKLVNMVDYECSVNISLRNGKSFKGTVRDHWSLYH